MKPIRTAVIGVGTQGERQAQKLAALPEAELVAVVDVDGARADSVASALETEAVGSYRDIVDRIDAAVLVTPTSSHFEIGTELLSNGVHLLIEKPITTTVDEARELVRQAKENSLVLQVGHLERFNPVVMALNGIVEEPQFVESIRIAPYKPRSLDVSVVLDLMIHDIDLIHSFVRSPMVSVDAVGRSVFSDSIDIANARIWFENGCVANVTSSRISMKTERTLRIIQNDSYVSADLHNKTLSRYAKKSAGPVTGPQDITVDADAFDNSDAMLDQARAFLHSIGDGTSPLVSGLIGMQALETALVAMSSWNHRKTSNTSTFRPSNWFLWPQRSFRFWKMMTPTVHSWVPTCNAKRCRC